MLRNFFLKVKNNKPLLLVWITLTSTFPFMFYTWPYHPYKILTFVCHYKSQHQILTFVCMYKSQYQF